MKYPLFCLFCIVAGDIIGNLIDIGLLEVLK